VYRSRLAVSHFIRLVQTPRRPLWTVRRVVAAVLSTSRGRRSAASSSRDRPGKTSQRVLVAVCTGDHSIRPGASWDPGGKGALSRWSGINLWTRVFARIPVSRRCDSSMVINTNSHMANSEGKPVSVLACSLWHNLGRAIRGDGDLPDWFWVFLRSDRSTSPAPTRNRHSNLAIDPSNDVARYARTPVSIRACSLGSGTGWAPLGIGLFSRKILLDVLARRRRGTPVVLDRCGGVVVSESNRAEQSKTKRPTPNSTEVGVRTDSISYTTPSGRKAR